MRKNNWVYNLFRSIKYSKERKLNCIFLEDIQFKDKYIDISKPKEKLYYAKDCKKSGVAVLKIRLQDREYYQRKEEYLQLRVKSSRQTIINVYT